MGKSIAYAVLLFSLSILAGAENLLQNPGFEGGDKQKIFPRAVVKRQMANKLSHRLMD